MSLPPGIDPRDMRARIAARDAPRPAPPPAADGDEFFDEGDQFFETPPTAPELPPSGLRTAYAQPGDILPNAQTWEREGVRAEQIGRTLLQQGANAFSDSMAMLGGSASSQSSPAEEEIPPDASPELIASIKESTRNRHAAERDAAAEPRAADVGSFIGQLPAYIVAGRAVEDLLPSAPAGASALARVGRVAHGAVRGALENAAVQVPQGGDPSDTLAVGAMFGAAPHVVREGISSTEDLAARVLRGPAADATAHSTGATLADLPAIQRRLGSTEGYADAVRRLRGSGRIPRDATPEQARAIAQQILAASPGAREPIMRAETTRAATANPTVAERGASPDVAERGRVDNLVDLINEHHDQVAAAHAVPEEPYVDRPPERNLRNTTNNQILTPEQSEARGQERAARRERQNAATPPRGRRARVDPNAGTVMAPTQRLEEPAAPRRALNIQPGHPEYIPPPTEADIEALGQRTRELAETRAARAAAPRPSEMEPLTRALERRGSDIDQAAREAINRLVEGRSGLTGEALRDYQAADEIRRFGERGPGRGAIPQLEVPQGNPLNARYYLGRMIPRVVNRALTSEFMDDLLTRVIRRGVHEQPGGHTPARHALSAVLTAYHQSGDRRGAAEHHRQVQTDPYYRDLTRRKSRE